MLTDLVNQIKQLVNIDWQLVFDYIFSLTMTAFITYAIVFIVRMALHKLFLKTHFIDVKKEATIESVVKTTSNYILFIVIIIAAIKPFVENLQQFMVAGGLIAAVIGFGAQKIINDLLSGIFMIFEKTIQQGDFVNINGEPDGGTVEEIGFRALKIRLINGKLVTIPNGEIRKMVNGSVEKRRIFESVLVSFEENPSKVLALLQDVCNELNTLQKQYLKQDRDTGEFIEIYQVYGLHSLDTTPVGYKFTITATVEDHLYLTASQEAKVLLAQKLFENQIKMPKVHPTSHIEMS